MSASVKDRIENELHDFFCSHMSQCPSSASKLYITLLCGIRNEFLCVMHEFMFLYLFV